ncbi:MAG: acetolactate synthase large subunit [Catenulispora sp.]|nr:acetolactate synthase large subunit [Catenulispora sp.]
MAEETVTGAEALMAAAVQKGVRVCFANPGTTEMPLVAALDRTPDVRGVLGLQENVCTGAADGYARITGRAAMTLLHLGPGLANGLANLHNARRAHTPVVNVVGDHTSWHLPYDAPLTSDIAALATTVGSAFTVAGREDIDAATRAAIDDAHRRPGVATLIVPADHQQDLAAAVPVASRSAAESAGRRHARVDSGRVKEVATRIRSAGASTVLILGGDALTRRGQQAAGRIAALTGAALFSETFPAVAERGAGLPAIDRLPYFPEAAIAALGDRDLVVIAGAEEPVAYFGYAGLPSRLARPETLRSLARPGEDAEEALLELADLLGAAEPADSITAPKAGGLPDPDAPLTGATVGQTVAACLPEDAIVSVEGGTCGYPFYTASAGASAHTALTNTGGAIGQGLPVALGAAIAAPDRPVIALQSDGSGLYTAQALWSMSRENVNVTVLIAANHTYNVLRTELNRHGESAFGPKAAALTSLSDPRVDWIALAAGYGVPGRRATTVAELSQALQAAIASDGPHLIEMSL